MVLTTVGPLEACAELLEMNEALRALKAGCNREIIVLKNLINNQLQTYCNNIST